MMSQEEDFLRPLLKAALQEVLEAEMSEAVGAAKGERSSERQSYRSGYYGRKLVTRVGTLELRVPQDRQGRFQHGSLRALPAEREGVGGGAGGDVRAGGFDAQTQGDQRGTVRARV